MGLKDPLPCGVGVLLDLAPHLSRLHLLFVIERVLSEAMFSQCSSRGSDAPPVTELGDSPGLQHEFLRRLNTGWHKASSHGPSKDSEFSFHKFLNPRGESWFADLGN